MNLSAPPSTFEARGATEAVGVPSLAFVEPHARALAFEGCFGYLHPAGGEVGVVICGAWGYEALCAHRATAEFAELLADAGYPTLRFDFPGAGNSRGDLAGRSLDDWIASVSAAAATLRKNSNAQRIVLAGFSFGCLIALAAAKAGLEADGFLLFAPPLSGRRYIRETMAFAAMVAAPNDGSDEVEEGALSIAGFVMPAAFVAQARALDLAQLAPPKSGFAMIAGRPDSDSRALVEALSAQGARVDLVTFDGYAELLAGPILAKTPEATFRRIAGLLAERRPPGGVRVAPPRQFPPAILVDGEIVEEVVRFGEAARLSGVICRPRVGADGAPVVVMVNVGRNAHTGWRRMPVETARALARKGVASLRFDIGGIGESASRTGQPQQILYSDWPQLDTVEAIDFLMSRNFGAVTLLGVCSGAYIALQTAVADARVTGLVAINLFRMVWNPDDSVEQALRFSNRPMGAAVTRMFTRERLGKVLSGKFDARPGLTHLVGRFRRWAAVSTMGWLGRLGPRGALYAECMRRFGILRARHVATVLGYSAGDEGYNEIADYFGSEARLQAACPDVRVAVIENCDHNLTPARATDWLVGQIDSVVARTARRV
jgi:pimeloyl-ACP methyl ester carboxylesterase